MQNSPLKYDSINQNIEKFLSPGMVIAGLRGGSGKTIFSIGVIAALRQLGISVAPFKKGPDYIDAGWLTLTAGRPCHNLDTFLIEQSELLSYYKRYNLKSDFSLIEGNRGIYDCINTKGDTSTASLAKLLNLPVILCIDSSKTTRTMAAIISGILHFDPNVKITGIVLNRIAGVRHQKIITKSIKKYCGIPVLGAIPKLTQKFFPERHMGLVPTLEHRWAKKSIKLIREIIKKYTDVYEVIRLTMNDKNFSYIKKEKTSNNKKFNFIKKEKVVIKPKPIIGIMLDSAFQFYYPENLEALKNAGAKLIFISPLKDEDIPDVDGLYIGGGFPETHAKSLEENKKIRNKIKLLAESWLPIYAECGGLIYLGDKLLIENNLFLMVGVFPAIFKIWKRPKGHGYTIVKVERKNPYYSIGSVILGHEFHYSSVYKWNGDKKQLAFTMKRGTGFINRKDGVFYKNVMATYSHIHALGTKNWAISFVKRIEEHMKEKKLQK